jgi:hypothetical protein
MIERVEVEDAANPLPKLAIEPALELERAFSFGWIRRGKRGLGTVLVDVVDDGAGALNDAPASWSTGTKVLGAMRLTIRKYEPGTRRFSW